MKKDEELILIPKYEEYIKYILQILIKLPRVEKFSIGTEYKKSMYETIKNILYITKIQTNRKETLNKIDAELILQRIYLRIMYENYWIDTKKFKISIEKIGEIGKIVGGLIKYYGKMDKKQMEQKPNL